MQFVVIGEMVNSLSVDFQEKHSSLPIHQIVGMRNEIAHGYFEIKPETVWQTVQKDIPELKRDIKKIIKR